MDVVSVLILVFGTCIIGTFCAVDKIEISDAKDTLEETHGKIIHASVLFRHGDRTPTTTFPTNPYPLSLPIWSEGLSQLNKKGKLRLYNLGKWFRERYLITPGLLQGYQSDTLLMNSSDYDRTLMSAELLLAGLLPPNEDEMWATDGLHWQPIPVHTKPVDEDPVISQEQHCERFDLASRNAEKLPVFREFYQENLKLLEFVVKSAGYNIPSSNAHEIITEVQHIFDTLFVEGEYGLTLPSWTEGIYPQPLTSVNIAIAIFLQSSTPEMRRLHAGPILGSIVSDMQQKQSGCFNQTYHFYSGHDLTILSLLYTLGVYDYAMPLYGASVIIELRLKGTEFVVTIQYRNSTETGPKLLTVAECGYICSLDKFVEITKPLIPGDYEEECQVGWFEKLFSNESMKIGLIVSLFLLIFTALACTAIWLIKRVRSKEYTSI